MTFGSNKFVAVVESTKVEHKFCYLFRLLSQNIFPLLGSPPNHLINMSQLLTEADVKSEDFNNRQNARLTRDSKAVVLIQELIASGKINQSTEPKAVWLSDPIFQAHKLANFRTCFNNIKKEASAIPNDGT